METNETKLKKLEKEVYDYAMNIEELDEIISKLFESESRRIERTPLTNSILGQSLPPIRSTSFSSFNSENSDVDDMKDM